LQGLWFGLQQSNNYAIGAGFYGDDVQGKTPVLAGQWYHAAFVFNQATYAKSVYLNGVLEGSQTGKFLTNSGCNIYVATYGAGPNSVWAGQISSVQFWPAALTPLQVAAMSLGAGGLPKPTFSNGPNVTITSVIPIGYTTGSLGLAYSSFSFSAWILYTGASYPPSSSACITGAAAASDGCNQQDQGLQICVSSGKLSFDFYSDLLTGTTTLSAGTWYHVGYAFDNAAKMKKVYLNGVLDASGVANDALLNDGCSIFIGSIDSVPSVPLWAGQISGASYYNSVLTSAPLSVMVNGYGSPISWSSSYPTGWTYVGCVASSLNSYTGAATGANGLGVTTYLTAAEGTSYVLLTGNNCALQQEIPTLPGVSYTVRFHAATLGFVQNLSICVETSPLLDGNLSYPVAMYTLPSWKIFSYYFVPAEYVTLLSFSVCNGGPSDVILLDGVIVTQDSLSGPVSRDECNATEAESSEALSAAYAATGGIFTYHNIFCHRRRFYTGIAGRGLPDTECANGGMSDGPCQLGMGFSTYVPGVPKECASDGNRRRALDSDAWPVQPSWEDVECSHRRRDSRRRQPTDPKLRSGGSLLANNTVVYPGNTSGPHIFTLGLYSETSGRIFHVGENQFNGRFQANDAGIIMRTCDLCAPGWQRIYYRRFNNISRFNPFFTFACGWNNPSFNPSPSYTNFSNVYGVDYKLYDYLQDALNDQNAWSSSFASCGLGGDGTSAKFAGFPGGMGGLSCQASAQWESIPAGSCTTVVPAGQVGVSATVAYWILEDAVLVQARKPQDPNTNGMVAWFKSENAGPIWKSAVSHHVGFAMSGSVITATGSVGESAWLSSLSNGFAFSYGASMPVNYIAGTPNEQFTFGTILTDSMTICSITRYNSATIQGRILLGGDTNLFHGHWQGYVGAVYYDTWLTAVPQAGGFAGVSAALSPSQGATGTGSMNWLVLCSARKAPVVYDNSFNVGIQELHRAQGLSINKGGCCWTTDQSSWAVMEVIVWSRTLEKAELSLAAAYLQWKLEIGTNRADDNVDPYPIMPQPLPQQNNLEAWFRNADIVSSGGFFTSWVDKINQYSVTVNASALITGAAPPPANSTNGSNASNASNASTTASGSPDAFLPLSVIADVVIQYGAASLLTNVVYGTIHQMVDFGPVLKQTFTVCSVTRYSGLANQGTILVGSNGDIHGHWNGRVGVANYGTVWRTQQWNRNVGSVNWLIFCGSNAGGSVTDGTSDVAVNNVDARVPNYMNPFMVPVNGSNYDDLNEVDYNFYLQNTQNLQINTAAAEGYSDFALFELAVWNTQLSLADMQTVAQYYMYVLKYGLDPYGNM